MLKIVTDYTQRGTNITIANATNYTITRFTAVK